MHGRTTVKQLAGRKIRPSDPNHPEPDLRELYPPDPDPQNETLQTQAIQNKTLQTQTETLRHSFKSR